MSSYSEKIISLFNDKKFVDKIFFLTVLLICILKIPPIFQTDIQPWDEGMYALRVLSIHLNGDFIDQSQHSTGGFYSGSHPPLLIWIGYFVSLVTGLNSPTLKLIIFFFSLCSLLILYKLGSKLFDNKTALLSVLIFSSTIIFNVFSKRFQFDIPYTFFILLSVYLLVLYNESKSKKYLYFTGFVFGLCLMVKILVGIFIPMIFLASYFFINKKVNYTLKDIITISIVGIVIAAPWHIYMLTQHGTEFFSYFFGFHIFDRAFSGLEHNSKGSGPLYHINYLFNIIPFSILIFYSMIVDISKFRDLSWKKIFLWGWFLTGLVIITFFRTKLEVYILLVLSPGVLLLSQFIFNYSFDSFKKKFLAVLLLLFNLIWYFTDTLRQSIKTYISETDILIILLILGASVILLLAISFLISRYIRLRETLIEYVIFTFLVSNIFYLFKIPSWENTYQISEIKSIIDNNPENDVVYVASNYRHNPQLSFYFEGVDEGWTTGKYKIQMYDTKNGTEQIRESLLYKGETVFVIVEKDNINRAEYPESELFIPDNFNQIYKTRGYELYTNR